MSARFAGSRSVDERRRRRLASGADDMPNQDSDLKSESNTDIPDEHTQRTNFYPIGSLFPKTFWKASLCISLVLLAGGSIIYLGILTALQPSRFQPHWNQFLDLSHGPLATWLSATLLLLAGQLSFLIGWARSRSIQDFSGRYRTWKYIACSLLFSSLCVGTGLHTLIGMHLGQLAAEQVLIPVTQQMQFGWFVPAFVIGAILMTRLDRELRGHFVGLHCVWVAALLCGLAGLLPLQIYPAAYQHVIPSALVLTGHLLLFCGLYMHIRFVIHVCPDPAPVQRLKLRFFKLRLPSLRLPKLRKSKPKSNSEKVVSAKPEKAPRAKSAKAKVVEQANKSTEIDNTNDQNDWDEQEEFASRKQRTKRRPRQNNIRIDQAEEDIPEPKSLKQEQPIDPEMLKGLSKRERRKLRKQMRDEQRANKRGQYS